MKKVAIFCSANDNIKPIYFQRVEELGAYLGKAGYTIIYGGVNMGLMECIGKASKLNGGHTVGVIPSKVEEWGKVSEYIDERIDVTNLSVRKDVMLEQCDVVLALPGGIGTLDEIFTVAASNTIGFHDKKVILYNIDHFWDKLITLIEYLQDNNFIRGNYKLYFEVANSLDEVKRMLADSMQPTLF